MKRCVFAVSMALAAGLPFAGLAVEYFADAVHGSDSYDGTAAKWAGGESTVGPKKTVQAAVDLADGNGTIVTLLPGVYDEGGAVNAGSYSQSNRVVVTKSNVTLRSSTGKAKDVHIVGRESTVSGNDHGIGEGAMRCLAVNSGVSGVVASGITFRDGCGASNTHRGGGMISLQGIDSLTIVDCVVSNCASPRGGGCYNTVAHSSLFTGNYSSANYGSVACFCKLANCLVIYNSADSKYPFAYMYLVVNCTIAMNGGSSGGVVNGTSGSPAVYNTLVFGQDTNAFGNYSVFSSVFEGQQATTGSADESTVINAVAAEECASPVLGDWRSLSTGHCANRGQGEYLGLVPMPEGYTYHDMAGNVIDTNGTVTVGAYQEVVTPAAARLVFGSGYEVEGSPYPRWGLGDSWITPLAWPVAYRFKWYVDDITYAIYLNEEFSDIETDYHPFYYAEHDGWTTIVPWHDSTATNTLARQKCTNRFYVDAVNGSDDYDGTAATWAGGESKVGPKKTIQAAADTNAVLSGYTFVYVAPGVYDEGGAFANSASNRVYDCSHPIGFIAAAGPGTATIMGAPDPITKGLGDNAMRCVYLNHRYSFVQGFNITGGYTVDNTTGKYNGGGVFCNSLMAQVMDCNVTNNQANYCGALYNCTAIRCRIFGNTAARGAVSRSSRHYRCLVDGNVGPRQIDAYKALDSCTIGPNAKTAEGGKVNEVVYNGSVPILNSVVMSTVSASSSNPSRATNCVFTSTVAISAENMSNCIITNQAAVACDEDFRPIVGANVGIDRADDSLSCLSYVWTPDLSGRQDVMNGVRDLGALEADWRPKYAADLGGHCTVSAVSPEVRENADGHVCLPSGTLEGSFDAMSRPSRRQLGVRVTGNGTLTVTVAGEVVGEFTANGGDVQNMTLALSTAGDAFSFAYAPGKNDTGGAEIVECTRLVGTSIVVR